MAMLNDRRVKKKTMPDVTISESQTLPLLADHSWRRLFCRFRIDCLTICCNVGNHGKPKNKPTTWGWFIMFIAPVYAVIFDLFLSPRSKRSLIMRTLLSGMRLKSDDDCPPVLPWPNQKLLSRVGQQNNASMKMAGCDLCDPRTLEDPYGPAIPGTPRLGDITNAFLNLVAGQQPLGSS